MVENTIIIRKKLRPAGLLPLEGYDLQGNHYQVDQQSFLKNGKRFLPVMGEFHFSRYAREEWREAILKMRAGGVDIVATYVFWIHHEERRGEWDFTGNRDLHAFLEVCRSVGMPVWLRIGPWCHGECRNGGFPDWVVSGDWTVRMNDPAYLELVRAFFGRIGEQARGEMCQDGGPVIGVQLENEYGHCGGAYQKEDGFAHMRTLKAIARECGLMVPYYTATAWGGGYVVDGEMLPVLGGYVDAPWANGVEEQPACGNFVFASYRQDDQIGADWAQETKAAATFDLEANPYLTAELGGGLQVTSHRRTYPWPEDIEAQSLCMLGSGANLLGYYMYHGGYNPDGRDTTLQESRATGYFNDLPIKSYDFQTCIRESGEINSSFGRLKKLHTLTQDFGELLAGSEACFAALQPQSPEDLDTLRVTARVHHELGVGILFVNNHQRLRRMKPHRDATVRLEAEDWSMELLHLSVSTGETLTVPFRIPKAGGQEKKTAAGIASQAECRASLEAVRMAELFPLRTNLSLFGRVGSTLIYYKNQDVESFFEWEGEPQPVLILTREEADRAFRREDCLYLVQHEDSCLIQDGESTVLLTKDPEETLLGCLEDGSRRRLSAGRPDEAARRREEAKQMRAAVNPVAQTKEASSQHFRDYQVILSYGAGTGTDGCLSECLLALPYRGDRAEVYQDGRLLADWFTTGEVWHLALHRFEYPESLTVRVYASDSPMPNPYGNQVYYDLPVEPGCELLGAEIIPVYRLALEVE